MFPVEEFRETVRRLAAVLDLLAVRFHLTGGAAAIAYAEPRVTQDVDVVVDRAALLPQLDAFVSAVVAKGFLCEATAVREAVRRERPFQLLDVERVLKVDLYPRELVSGELGRSVPMPIFEGLVLPVVARADLICAKLVWIERGSHRSRRDVRSLWSTAKDDERASVRAWATERGSHSLLDEVLAEPDEIDA